MTAEEMLVVAEAARKWEKGREYEWGDDDKGDPASALARFRGKSPVDFDNFGLAELTELYAEYGVGWSDKEPHYEADLRDWPEHVASYFEYKAAEVAGQKGLGL